VSGGVTFCTLMPMRAVPFRVVCLLGMNDGDFPRRASKADFDLLALPGMARPGDRSRRDDDRYLMLEAVLAARDKLYISWCGRNVRDNSEQPASVLVSQLCDYLKAGWGLKNLDGRSTGHALQPFSRVYFEDGGLLTYAGEWRAAHAAEAQQAIPAQLPPFELDEKFRLRLSELANFIKQPVRYFFRRRLGVIFGESALVGEDEEPFSLNALERYVLEDVMLDDAGADVETSVRGSLAARAERLRREGVLPIGLLGERMEEELVEALVPVRSKWLQLRAEYQEDAPKLAIGLTLDGIVLEDWVDQLHRRGAETVWLMQMSSKALDKAGQPRGDKLIGVWLRQLAVPRKASPWPASWWRAMRCCAWRRWTGRNRTACSPRWRACGAPIWTSRCRSPARPAWRWRATATRAASTTAVLSSRAKWLMSAWRACGPISPACRPSRNSWRARSNCMAR
jgi:exodeoxyribonuclease V gamma subunit